MKQTGAPLLPGRGRGGNRGLWRRLEPLAVVLLVLGAWEAATQLGVVSSTQLPTMTSVLSAFVEDVQTNGFWRNLGQSLGAWLVGLAIVTAIGIPVGLALGLSSIAYRMSHLTLEFVRTIPSIAALPLLILVYGVGFRLAVVLVILTAVWPLIIQAMYGAHDVDPVARDTARVYGLGRLGIFAKVVVPSSLPYIATGLRLAGVIALLVAISESLIAGGEGLGAAIANAQASGDVSLMYARIFATGVVGLIVTYGLTTLERRTLHWHTSQRSVVT